MRPIQNLHKTTAMIAILTIVIFWSSTVISELFMGDIAVATVKRSILFYGLPILIISLMMTGISGNFLAKNHSSTAIQRKKRRMRLIALNGILMMIPLVIYLYLKSSQNEFDGYFYSAQLVELALGLIQLFLMSKQILNGKEARVERLATNMGRYRQTNL